MNLLTLVFLLAFIALSVTDAAKIREKAQPPSRKLGRDGRQCPDSWDDVNGICYKIMNERGLNFEHGYDLKNYTDGLKYCQAANPKSSFAVFRNSDEWKVFTEYLKESRVAGSYIPFYLGGTDVETEGKFMYEDPTNGVTCELPYQPFYPGNPDNYDHGDGIEEDCIRGENWIREGVYKWNDDQCNQISFTICQLRPFEFCPKGKKKEKIIEFDVKDTKE